MSQSLSEIFHTGGWVMWPLLVFSILSLAIILERTWILIRIRPLLRKIGPTLLKTLEQEGLTQARALCEKEPAPIAELYLSTLNSNENELLAARKTERNRIRLRTYLKKNLWILGTIGSASPFVGLLGTVMGILDAFHDMAAQGAGGFSVVAGGISEALIATAAGLIVAIVALLAFNIFTTAANQTVTSTKLDLEELLESSSLAPVTA